jgi:hypothetical protein
MAHRLCDPGSDHAGVPDRLDARASAGWGSAAMNEPTAEPTATAPASLRGRRVVTADGVLLGEVDGETASHVRVHTPGGDAPDDYLWVPRDYIRLVEDDEVHLHRARADLHDAVLSLSPGEQREFASLKLPISIGRHRWLRERPEAAGRDRP